MKLRYICMTFALGISTVAMSAPTTIAAMTWKRRILLVAAPNPKDPKAVLQRRIFSEWSRDAADRDVTLVEVVGPRVVGVSNSAQALRARYRLKADRFEVLLIGKDGHVAERSSDPIDANTLASTIDAMPMRKAGQR